MLHKKGELNLFIFRYVTLLSLAGLIFLSGCKSGPTVIAGNASDSQERKAGTQEQGAEPASTAPEKGTSTLSNSDAGTGSIQQDPKNASEQPATSQKVGTQDSLPTSQTPNLNLDSSQQSTTVTPIAKEAPVVNKILCLQERQGWAIGERSLLRTDDSGVTWQKIIPQGVSEKSKFISANFENAIDGYAYYLIAGAQPELRVLYQALNGGGKITGWASSVLPTKEKWETSADVMPYNPGYSIYDTKWVLLTSSPAAGLMNKSLYRSDNHGQTWTRVANISNRIQGYPTGISFRKPDEVWIAAMNHGQTDIPLYRTKDGGMTWDLQPVAIPDELKKGYANAYPPIFDEENDHHGVFIAEFVINGEKSYVPYETRDNGDTWNPLKYRLSDIKGPPVIHFDFDIEGRAISVDGSTIFTMDTYNKEDWKSLHPNIPLKDVSYFYLQHDGHGWAWNNGKPLITSDGGKTWNAP